MIHELILTDAGSAEIETAYQAGVVVNIVTAAFGDGGGAPVVADPSVTALVGQFGEEPFAAGGGDTGMIGGVVVIPAKKYPGQTLREFGLMSESGTLIAYGAYPDTWLPAQEDTIVKEITVKFVMPLVHAECVTLEIDPNIAVITQETGDKRYLQQALRLKEIADQGEEAQAQAREHLAVYGKTESDERFQPKGNYTPAGEAYTKTESDERYLNEAENLADVPDKAAARKSLDIYSKGEGDGRYQPKGNYTPAGEAYTKAESDARYLQKATGITGIRMANYGSVGGDLRDSSQNVMTGIYATNGYDNATTHESRKMQYQLNGSWYNAPYV